MLASAQLSAALQHVPVRAALSGPFARAIPHVYLSVSPHGDSGGPQPLWPRGPALSGARYTLKGGAPALYLGVDADVAFAEVGTTFSIGGAARLTGLAPMTLIKVSVHVRDVLDLTDVKTCAALETSLQELTGLWRVGPQPAATQLLGDLVARSGRFDALIAPSARVAEKSLLVVFTDRLRVDRGTFCEVERGGVLVQRMP